jgi:hypothetical protein
MNNFVVQPEATRVRNAIRAEPEETGLRRITSIAWRAGFALLLLVGVLSAVVGCEHDRHDRVRYDDRRERYDGDRHEERREADRRVEDRGDR